MLAVADVFNRIMMAAGESLFVAFFGVCADFPPVFHWEELKTGLSWAKSFQAQYLQI